MTVKMFEPYSMGKRTAPNRMVCQPMEGNDGGADLAPSARTLERYSRLAEGGWGIVFVEATSVTRTSIGGANGAVLDEETAPVYEQLVKDFKQKNPDALLLIQLTHSGRNSRATTVKTSVCPDTPEGMVYLSEAEIDMVGQQFVETALLAEKLGFDGVDIKLCHGYFGAEILRPANTREDRWGGSFDNRVSFVEGVVEEIGSRRSSADFLLGSRISYYENVPGGMGTAGPDTADPDFSEIHELLRRMDKLGMDFVDVSSANTDPWPPEGESLSPEECEMPLLWFERLAKEFVTRESLRLTVIGSGYSGLKAPSVEIAEKRVTAGMTDLPGWGRESIADPLFPLKLQAGKEIDWCVGCFACGRLFGLGRHSGCIVYNDYYKQVYKEPRVK